MLVVAAILCCGGVNIAASTDTVVVAANFADMLIEQSK